MDFGLGLILSFTDNASAGINNAVNSLDRLTQTAQSATSSLNGMASLSALSVVAGQMGNAFTSAGGSILGVFTNLLGNVRAVGQDFEGFRITLDALYGQDFPDIEERTKAVNAQLQKLLDFSVKSPFEVNDVKDMLVVLKSQGIDAFSEMQGAVTGTKQETLAWIADMMAFKPEVPAERWKLAFQNFIGSGESKMLRNVLDMGKIEEVLGHSIGSTVEERMANLVEIIDKKGLTGLANKMTNTWQGVASNVSDAFTKLYKVIADNGVFDALKSSFMGLAGLITTLSPDDLNALGKALADGLNTVVAPIVKVVEWVNKLVMGFIDLVKQNPGIAKFAVVMGVVTGALLTFVGLSLKAMSALSGLALMYMAFGQSFNSIGALFRAGALKIMGVLIPLGLAIATLYAVWKTDFAGIRTTITTFVTSTVNSFKTAKTAVSGSLADMQKAISGLDIKNNFFDGLTYSIMRLMTLGRALVEGWNSYTLSEDTFQKARELGILPLIEAIFDFLYRFRLFKEGFIAGWNEISTAVKNAVGGILQAVDGTVFESMFQGVLNLFNALTNNDPQAWTEMGEAIGRFVAKAVLIAPIVLGVISVGKKVISIISGIVKIVKPLIGLVAAHPVIAAIVGVIAALAILYANSEDFRNLVGGVIDKFRELGQYAIATFGPVLMEAFNALKAALPPLIDAFNRILAAVGPIVEKLIGLVIQILPTLSQVIGSIITTVISLLPTITQVITTIANVIGMVLEVVGELLDLVIPFIVDVVDMLGNLISDVLPILADLISNIMGAVTHVINLVLPMLKRIFQALMPIVQTILDIAKNIISRLIPIIKSIISVVSTVIKTVIDVIMPIITVVMQIVETIIQLVSPIVDTILEAVGFIIDIILGIVQVVMSVVNFIVSIVGGVVSFIMGIINTIVQFIMMCVGVVTSVFQVIVDTITGIISGIVGVVQGVWDGIVGVFSGAFDFFAGVFNSIFEVVSGVFTSIADFFTSVWDGIVSVFATLGDTISGAIKGAVNGVLGFAVGVINGFIKAINFAIGIINAIPGVEIAKLTELSVPQLAMGGVVTKPTTAIIGEAGAEAVMPLENNKQWIGLLAKDITSSMENLTPVGSSSYTTNNADTTYEGDTSSEYLTTNQGAVSNDNSQYDQRVVFEKESIVIYAQNATEEEAERLANLVMEKIKRKQELERMRNYQPVH